MIVSSAQLLAQDGIRALAGGAAGGWKVVAAAIAGPAHRRLGALCQDAFAFAILDDRDLLIAAIADGAGSAPCGGEGARICTRALVRALTRVAQGGSAGATAAATDLPAWEGAIRDGIGVARAMVRMRMEAAGRAHAAGGMRMQDYHATLLGAVAGPEGGVLFHIGDGAAAVAAGPAEADWDGPVTSPPENGEYANETCFFTEEDWQDHLRLTPFRDGRMIVLMTDGVTPFAMLPGCTGLEPRFMGPVSRHLATAEPGAAARALANTLDAERARAISADDKTLLWAVRQPADPA